jgi:hypothetical protein
MRLRALGSTLAVHVLLAASFATAVMVAVSAMAPR